MIYVLSIAGSDSCGGAGIQADIKTITRLGAHALTAVAAVTAQNSRGITAVQKVPAKFISKQIETILDDIMPQGVKIGMLSTGAAVRAVAEILRRYEISDIVLDPVLRASTGQALLDPKAISLMVKVLLPLARVVTPNLGEAGILSGKPVGNLRTMKEAAKKIKALGPDVVITGGHMKDLCIDLVYDGKAFHRIEGPEIRTPHTHGTGCVFSTALATYLAMGHDLAEAAERAHHFTRRAIEKGYPCGRGSGPVNPA